MKGKKVQIKGKAPKPAVSRKPPEAMGNHAAIEEWIQRAMPDLQPIIKSLDALICNAIPGIEFAIKWNKAYYGVPEYGWIIEMVAYDVSVNMVFHGGKELDPPPPLGDAGRSRYVKVKTVEEAQMPLMLTWIKQASRVRGWK